MNILAIPSFYGLSSPKNGGQNRFSNIIKELISNGHNVIILESTKFFENSDSNLAKVYMFRENHLGNRELPTTRDLNIEFILKLLQIIKTEKIELIQFSHLSGISTSKLLIKILNKKVPIVYDAHNVESDFVSEVIGNNPEYSKLNRTVIPLYIKMLEKISCKYLIDYMTCVSYVDKCAFLKKYNIDHEKISVINSGCRIPNLINKDKAEIKIKVGFNPNKLVIFFHGSFSHPPNKESFNIIENKIAPKFESYDNVVFILGGSGIPKYKRKNVESIGSINNLYETISAADIAIVPLKTGGGTKLKMFDYLCMGLPIVTTEKGAEGIELLNGVHALIYESINKNFIDGIKFLILNENERVRLGNNARKIAREKYDWKMIGAQISKLYSNLQIGKRLELK